METPVSSPWTEWIGTSHTTVTDGETLNLDVYIPEFIPDIVGDPTLIIDQAVGVPSQWEDPGGAHMIHIKRMVTCTYLGGTNAIVPCVHMGERVRVLCYAGNEQYYWLPLGRDPGIRLHERIRWFAMCQPDSVVPQSYKEVMDTNSYFIDFNTNPGSKQWHLHTSDADGEPIKYDWYIWPDLMEMVFFDSFENFFHLWSEIPKWWLHNFADSNVILDGPDIIISCPGNIKVFAGASINVEAGMEYTRLAPIHNIEGAEYSLKMAAFIAQETAIHSIAAPAIVREGDLSWMGNMLLGGGSISNGMEGHICPDPLACW